MPTDPRGRDRSAVIAATIAAMVMIAQQIAGKATRDALFLTSFPATELPKVVIAAAAISVVGVLGMSRFLSRVGPVRVVPGAFAVSGLLFGAEWLLVAKVPGPIAWVVYLHMAAFGAITISGFWSVVNERFDPHAAKRHVARIGVGATFGGILGGLTAERVAALLDVRTMLLVLAVLNILCGLAVSRIGAPPGRRRSASDNGAASGLRILGQSSYLRSLGALVALVAVSAALLDYAFKSEASYRLESGETLMQFFALYYTATAVLTFVLQTTLAKQSLKRLGLAGTIAMLPAAVIVLGVVGAAVTRLTTVVILRGVEAMLANSLFRSGYELLYTPVPPAQKRPTKTIIDVACERLGDAGGSGLVLLLIFFIPELGTRVVIGVGAAVAIASLWIARSLHRGYVERLADSLRTGAVHLEDEEILDATTKRTLSETTMALDREKLLAEIRALRESQPGSTSSDDALLRGSRPSSLPPAGPNVALRESVDALMSQEPERVRQALSCEITPRLVGHLIPLLAHRDLHKEVIAALRKVAPRVEGQLVDALLDETQPFAVRRRVPRVLSVCDSKRAADGLFAALGDARFEVRYQSAQVLAGFLRRNEAIGFDQADVFEATLRELDVGNRVWESRRLLDDDPEEHSAWLDDVIRARMHRSLEHVFTLLSFTLDREPLELSLRALSSDDRTLRGTALEYLENVLPDEIRPKLWPYLGRAGTGAGPSRPRQQIVEDLLRSMDSMTIDRDSITGGSDGK